MVCLGDWLLGAWWCDWGTDGKDRKICGVTGGPGGFWCDWGRGVCDVTGRQGCLWRHWVAETEGFEV